MWRVKVRYSMGRGVVWWRVVVHSFRIWVVVVGRGWSVRVWAKLANSWAARVDSA